MLRKLPLRVVPASLVVVVVAVSDRTRKLRGRPSRRLLRVPMKRLFALVVIACASLAGACSDATVDDTGVGAQCAENGGTCVLGSVACSVSAPTSADDCNPDVNPGGGHCCISVAVADAGATD